MYYIYKLGKLSHQGQQIILLATAARLTEAITWLHSWQESLIDSGTEANYEVHFQPDTDCAVIMMKGFFYFSKDYFPKKENE